jgi:hypothetical protein
MAVLATQFVVLWDSHARKLIQGRETINPLVMERVKQSKGIRSLGGHILQTLTRKALPIERCESRAWERKAATWIVRRIVLQ